MGRGEDRACLNSLSVPQQAGSPQPATSEWGNGSQNTRSQWVPSLMEIVHSLIEKGERRGKAAAKEEEHYARVTEHQGQEQKQLGKVSIDVTCTPLGSLDISSPCWPRTDVPDFMVYMENSGSSPDNSSSTCRQYF